MPFKQVLANALKDISVELEDEFKKNFERKAFFDGEPWDAPKVDPKIGSIMYRTGTLASSIQAETDSAGLEIKFSSSQDYADIHNSGGEGLAWGKHKFTMPKRQFIGEHPVVENAVGEILDEHINAYMETFSDELKNRLKS